MKKRVLSYEGIALDVSYDVSRCIHAAECVHGLPAMFDPERKPWVDPGAASPEAAAGVIMRCPTGALHFERKDGGPSEAVPEANTITIDPNGPLFVHGDVVVADAAGKELIRDTRIALCRCGASKNKPLCDGSHADQGFIDPGHVGERGIKDVPVTERTLRVVTAENGPLLFNGPMRICGQRDDEVVEGGKAALCRCGASQNKPYCDGTHKEIGFSSV